METKKLLLIIDCQYDFITGSLAVEGAKYALDKLADYLSTHHSEYATIAATLDWHPKNHSSFKGKGADGIWPAHCVQYTLGAAFYDPIAQCVPEEILFFTKGDVVEREEYSIFFNAKCGPKLTTLIANGNYTQIDVCGLCGDYCVKASVSGLIELGYGDKINILLPYTPSIDGGTALTQFVKDNNLRTTE